MGSSLSGFSLTATRPVDVPIAFALNGSTELATAQEVSGMTEPATFVLLAPVVVAIGLGCPFRTGQRR